MDWSLALLSQGIESTIDRSEDLGWGLLVTEAEHERSLNIIRQYRIENVRWPWRQKINPQIVFDWGCLAWVLLIGVFFWFDVKLDLKGAGAMDGAAVSRGQWWRLFTPILLHANFGHLAANAGIGAIFLGLAMGRFGTGIALFAAYLAGAAGNVATWFVYQDHHSVGASGMVMGALGLLAAQSPLLFRKNFRVSRYLLSGMAACVMLFVLLGLDPETDVLAHIGGFIGGLLLGTLLLFAPRWNRNPMANAVAGGLFCCLVIATWRLALRAGAQ